jgi:hypothetical protein
LGNHSIIGNTLFAEWRLAGNGHEIFTAILDRLLASKELERGFSSGAAEELAAKPLQHRHNFHQVVMGVLLFVNGLAPDPGR